MDMRPISDRLLTWVSLITATFALLAGAVTFVYSRGVAGARTAATEQAFRDANMASQERDRAQQAQIDRLVDQVRDLCAARARDDRDSGRQADPYLCKASGNGG